jgi:dTDP-4-dehydrorhamnose reductase
MSYPSRGQDLRVLVLGASGFVGSFLTRNLPRALNQAWFQPSREDLVREGDGDFVLGAESAILSLRPNIVINLVAQTDFRICSESPAESSQANVDLPMRIAKALPNAAQLIHLSSDSVFGGGTSPYGVESPGCPTSSYGLQKWEADNGIIENRSNFLILRGSFFGFSFGGRLGTLEFFANAIRDGQSVPGFVDYVNNPISLIDLEGVVHRSISSSIRGVLHLGANNSLSKYEFGVLVAEAMGSSKDLIIPTPSPEGFHSHGGLDLSLDSCSSWDALGLHQPSVEEGVLKSLRESKYISGL